MSTPTSVVTTATIGFNAVLAYANLTQAVSDWVGITGGVVGIAAGCVIILKNYEDWRQRRAVRLQTEEQSDD